MSSSTGQSSVSRFISSLFITSGLFVSGLAYQATALDAPLNAPQSEQPASPSAPLVSDAQSSFSFPDGTYLFSEASTPDQVGAAYLATRREALRSTEGERRDDSRAC